MEGKNISLMTEKSVFLKNLQVVALVVYRTMIIQIQQLAVVVLNADTQVKVFSHIQYRLNTHLQTYNAKFSGAF